MIAFNIRYYYIVFAVLNASERNPVSSKSLSKKLSLSDKTVQNNIIILNKYCMENGFEIVSKSGNGFFPLIFDEVKSARLKQNLAIYFSKNFLTQSNNALQMAFFLLYIIGKDKPITINELCDKFYFSKSTIYTYLATAIQNLDYTANIKLMNDNNGIYTIADEFFKRYYVASCLANDTFLYDIEMLFGIDFHFLKPESPQTLKVMNLLQKYNFSLNDERFDRLLIYITYSHYRYLHKYKLAPNDNISYSRMKGLSEFEFSTELAKALNLSFMNDQTELATLAAVILISNDTPNLINTQQYGEGYFNEINALYNHLNDYLTDLAPEFQSISNYKSSLMQLVHRLYFIHEFDLLEYNFNSIALNLIQTPNALIRYIARLLTKTISDYFGTKMGHRNASYVCLFCENLLYSIQMEKTDSQILVILNEGNLFNEYIIEWLYNHLNPKPYAIKQMSLYEANTSNLNQYDLILSDYNELDFIQSKYPIYKISTPLDASCDFVNEYYRISNHRNISFEKLVSQFSHIETHDNCRIVNTENFLTQLDIDLDGLGNIPIRDIRKLGRPINYYADNKILIVPYLYKDADQHQSIMSIYFNGDKNKLKYDILVFLSIHSDFSLESLMKIMNICNEFCSNPDIFYKIQDHVKSID